MFLPVKQLKKTEEWFSESNFVLRQDLFDQGLRVFASNLSPSTSEAQRQLIMTFEYKNRVKNNRILSFLTKQISFMDFLLRRNLHMAESGSKALGTGRHN